MGDNDINIVVNAQDKASANLNKITNTTNKMKGAFASLAGGLSNLVTKLTGFNLAQIGVSAAIGLVTKGITDAVKETQAYNLAMVDLARKMGTTTEEASRLAQVGDDVRLSQEQISTAMTYAIRNGLEPNIEGLAELADKYNALDTPVKRGKLLLETFGRSGMDMAKLMEKGGDGIRSMSAAIEDSLIVTAEAAEESRRFYEAQDRLSDAVDGVKHSIGNGFIPVMVDLSYTLAAAARKDELYSEATERGEKITWKLINSIHDQVTAEMIALRQHDDTIASLKGVTYQVGLMSGSLGIAGQSAKDAGTELIEMGEDAAEAMTKANEETIKGVAKFTSLYESGEEKISELYGKRTELENDLQRLRSQGYSDEGENIKEVVGKMGEVDAAIQKTKDEFDKATNQIIFDYSLQMLAADGLTNKEMEGMLEWGKSVDLFSQNAVDAFNSAMARSKELSDSIQAIPDKTVNVNVVTRQYSEDYRSRGIEGGLMGGRGYAEGASFTVPPGYPNDSFPMRVESGEHVQVTPKGKASSGGNTNYNITLNYSPLVSLADRAEAEQKLVPFIESALRKARK